MNFAKINIVYTSTSGTRPPQGQILDPPLQPIQVSETLIKRTAYDYANNYTVKSAYKEHIGTMTICSLKPEFFI